MSGVNMRPLLKKIDTVELEKKAYSIRLGKDADDWPVTILQEAYKQVPYLRDYEVDVSLDRTDESRGYGIGKMLVYPNRMEKNAAIKADKIVSFPVIIRDHEMSPLDVVSYKDEIMPASESFVSETLFRPETFSGPAKAGQFGATGLGPQIDPPAQRLRQSIGINKHSSANILDAVLTTASNEQINSFKDSLASSPSLRVAALNNSAFGSAVERIISHKEKTASAMAAQRKESVKPNAIQFKKQGSSYFVKTANHRCYDPVETEVSRFDVQRALSKEDFNQLCRDSYLNISTQPIQKVAHIKKIASEIDRVGVYETKLGKRDILGISVPRVVSLDGQVLPYQYFVTQDGHSMQEKVAGVFKATVNLPTSEPRGYGAFILQEGRRALATEPLEVTNFVNVNRDGWSGSPKEKVAYCLARRASTGESIKISLLPIEKIAYVEPGHYAVPESMGFFSFPKKSIKVSNSIESFSDVELSKVAGEVSLKSDGNGAYQLQGSPLFTDIMNRVDTGFALSLHGYSSAQSENIMKTASEKGSINLKSAREIFSADAIKEGLMKKIASSKIDVSEIQVDLIKEASVIVDKETVDSILALKFLTPENVGMYVNYLQDFEKVASKLAEVLVASRLGMDDIKEVSAKNALSQMSTVIDGLKSLKSKIQ